MTENVKIHAMQYGLILHSNHWLNSKKQTNI